MGFLSSVITQSWCRHWETFLCYSCWLPTGVLRWKCRDHLRHDISVFKKCFHSFFFLHMPVLQSQRLKFSFALLWPLRVKCCATVLEQTEQEYIRETCVFFGIIYLWWQRFQNCLRLLEQTRIPTYTTVVMVQGVFTPNHRYLFFLQLPSAASHSVFGQLAFTHTAKK